MAVSFLRVTPGKPKIIINRSNGNLKEKIYCEINKKKTKPWLFGKLSKSALMLQDVKAQIWKQKGAEFGLEWRLRMWSMCLSSKCSQWGQLICYLHPWLTGWSLTGG